VSFKVILREGQNGQKEYTWNSCQLILNVCRVWLANNLDDKTIYKSFQWIEKSPTAVHINRINRLSPAPHKPHSKKVFWPSLAWPYLTAVHIRHTGYPLVISHSLGTSLYFFLFLLRALFIASYFFRQRIYDETQILFAQSVTNWLTMGLSAVWKESFELTDRWNDAISWMYFFLLSFANSYFK